MLVLSKNYTFRNNHTVSCRHFHRSDPGPFSNLKRADLPSVLLYLRSEQIRAAEGHPTAPSMISDHRIQITGR